MKLREFLELMMYQSINTLKNKPKLYNYSEYWIKGDNEYDNIYQNITIMMPRIYCNDGFTISIQMGNGHYCNSENGYRKFGFHFEKVEWGFPSDDIDGEKYGRLDEMVGTCEIDVLEDLIEEHKGLDIPKILEEIKNGMIKLLKKEKLSNNIN